MDTVFFIWALAFVIDFFYPPQLNIRPADVPEALDDGSLLLEIIVKRSLALTFWV